MSQALIPPTYAEAMAVRRHLQQLYGTTAALDYLLVSPAPTSAQLTTWLDIPENLEAYQRSMATHAGASAVCASTTAMAAIAGSTKALETLRESSTAIAALVNNRAAMDAVLNAGASAVETLFAVAAVRVAIYDNEIAWSKFIATDVGKSALMNRELTHSTNSTAHVNPTGVNQASKVVLTGQASSTSALNSYAGFFFDAYVTNQTGVLRRYVRVTGLTHRISGSGTSSIRYVPMQ